MNPKKRLIIIGGGAAGFFAAANVLVNCNNIEVIILEQGKEVLQKVKVSGGGRCNVSNANIERESLQTYYPRGWKLLRKLFSTFNNIDTIKWFESRSIDLKTERDNRIFPISNKSQTIIDCLMNEVSKHGGIIKKSCKVIDFKREDKKWKVESIGGETFISDYVLMATGSSPFIYNLLEKKSIKIVPQVPSLFTFNIKDERLDSLAGVAVQQGKVKLAGSKRTSEGPILITHHGLSGPSILKLSSWEARNLNNLNYQFRININWTNFHSIDASRHLDRIKLANPNKKLVNTNAFEIPKRLWKRLINAAQINDQISWKEIGKKQINKLIDQLTNGQFHVLGKSTFKDEFVTCGGVSLNDIKSKTLEHKELENLFFAGEVLDIDAVTGGFNFQSAWTTGYVVAKSILEKD